VPERPKLKTRFGRERKPRGRMRLTDDLPWLNPPLSTDSRLRAYMFDKPVRALLIEDSAADARLVAARLPPEAARWVRVVRVATLRTGLKQLKDGDFDVVILDLNLPDSEGLETIKSVHRIAADIPIVVLSGENDDRFASRAVRIGAQDFLSKSRVDRQSLLQSIQFAIERSGRMAAERKLRDSEEQIRLAKAVQQRLFPDKAPELAGFDLAGAVYPATATCGDYFDFIPLSSTSVAAIVADVSGHGAGPALLMAETRAYLRALAEAHSCPGEILTRANRLMSGDVGDDHFVSLFLACVDSISHSITYAGAGHAAYHIKPCGEFRKVDSTGLVLGLLGNARIESGGPFVLEPNELVLLMTDGLFETRNHHGELLGIDHVLSVVRAVHERGAEKIIQHLYNAARAFSGGFPQKDDIAMVIIKREA
jgi:phosphoserine phosphatase RsbU/P